MDSGHKTDTETDHTPCPLCGEPEVCFFIRDRLRSYFRCPQCYLIFVPPALHLSPEEEKQRYDLHQNNPEDSGYRKFLSKLFQPLTAKLEPASRGLDFGCGPGPALAMMFREQGYPCRTYDPFYNCDKNALEGQYDFISCTETAEHFCSPRQEFELLFSLLRPGGWLGIMTQFAYNKKSFRSWHYKEDETHICFYSKETMQWLAKHFELELELHGDSVALFRRSNNET